MSKQTTTGESSSTPRPEPVTQQMLQDALNDYIKVCHNGRVRLGCGYWYKAMKIFQIACRDNEGSCSCDQIMYAWAKKEVEKTKAAKQPHLRVVS